MINRRILQQPYTYWVLAFFISGSSHLALAQSIDVKDHQLSKSSSHNTNLWFDFDHTFSLRNEIWSGTRQLDDTSSIAQTALWYKGNLKHEQFGKLRFDGWLRGQYHFSGTQKSDRPTRRVREFYWRNQTEHVQINIGRQLHNWGRADGINPTDNLSPRDFTHLTPEDADQKYGTDSIKLTFSLPSSTLLAYYSPCVNSHTIPLQQTPEIIYQKIKGSCSQTALKWDYNSAQGDFSVSYFNGMDLIPNLRIAQLGLNGLTLDLYNSRSTVYGIDFSIPYQDIVWRGEYAYKRPAISNNDEPLQPTRVPEHWLVFGPEKQFADGLTVSLQLSYKHLTHFRSPNNITHPIYQQVAWQHAAIQNQTQARQYGVTWRIAKHWLNETLRAEFSGIAIPKGGLHRIKVEYTLTDDWSILLGANYYYGEQYNYFGLLKKNRDAYIQLRHAW